MHVHPVRHFRLSPRERGRGVSCDANGAFIDNVPLLKRVVTNGKEKWTPRACDDISINLSKRYGLPIDVSSKSRGIAAIAKAMNGDQLARAQLTSLFLRFPEPPRLAKNAASRSDWIRFIRELHSSGLLKATWEPEEHPRWPAGSTDSQGGRFAPKDNGDTNFAASENTLSASGAAQQHASGLIEVADRSSGPMCRELAAAGCVATSAATAG